MIKKILLVLLVFVYAESFSQGIDRIEYSDLSNRRLNQYNLANPIKLSMDQSGKNQSEMQYFLNRNVNYLSNLNVNDDQNSGEIDKTKVLITAGGLTGLFIGFHFYQLNAWWKDQRGAFHVMDDPAYACKMDKVGHFYGGYLAHRLGTACADWIGYDKKTSEWIGAGLGSLFQLYVEFEDGFGGQWGFSPGDATGDLLGAFYPLLQEYWEPLKPFNLKFSYVPSDELKAGIKKIIIDDYEGQTYWLTVNIYDLLPEETKKSYPDYLRWLQIAFGYGLRNYNGNFEFDNIHVTDKELYISLDYDLVKLLDIDTKFFRSLKENDIAKAVIGLLNNFHLPAPALRITFPSEYWATFGATGPAPGNYGKRDPKPQISVILYGFYFSN